MIGDRKILIHLHRIMDTVKGIETAQAWKMYCAIAFLCVGTALLIALQTAVSEAPARQGISGRQHALLPEINIAAPAAAPPSPPRETARGDAAGARAVKPAMTPTAEPGEWYYSEVHKDWRFRRP